MGLGRLVGDADCLRSIAGRLESYEKRERIISKDRQSLEQLADELQDKIAKYEELIRDAYWALRDMVWHDDSGEMDRLVAALGQNLCEEVER